MNARAADFAPPLLFGLAVLAVWEVGVKLLGVPAIILPAPSAIALRLATSVPTLAADFLQTIRGVLAGYAIGCGSGLAVAIFVDRSPFLQRGLLPLGNFVSALPIVGVAPIMVMWFGFDWQSKAAVVVVMTFFPMLVNATIGLAGAGPMERDLMKTYAADYSQTLRLLRLPAAGEAGRRLEPSRSILPHAIGRVPEGHASFDKRHQGVERRPGQRGDDDRRPHHVDAQMSDLG